MLTHRPAMKFILPFIAGILMGWKYSFPLLPILVGFVLLFGLFIFFSTRWRSLHASQICLSMMILMFGIAKITYDLKYKPDSSVSNFVSIPQKCILKGCIVDPPRMTDRSLRFVVEADSIIYGGIGYKTEGGVLVSVFKDNFDSSIISLIQYQKNVKIKGSLASIQTARNPGEFDLKNYLTLNGIVARFYPDTVQPSDIAPEPRHNFQSLFVYPVRASISEKIDRLIGGEEAKFLKGLVIGERSEIPLDVKTAFINAGVMHILAVSGLHVAIVVLMLLIILQVLRIPEKPRIIITSLLLVYYIMLTGGAASVARSVIMAIVFLSAKLFEQKSDMYNTLAVSAMILLLIDSKQLLQPGFQLSYVAVFSLIYLYPKISSMAKFFPKSAQENKIVKAIVASFAVSVAAGLGTLPFTSAYFGKISIISFLANLVIVPLSNVILVLGMLAVGLAYCSTWIASVYGELTSVLTWLLLRLVELFGNAPLAYIDSHFSLVASIIFYACVGIIIHLGRREYRGRLVIASLLILNLWLFGMIGFAPDEKLRVTFLDVGQGDAIFLEFPDGKKMLIDAGPKTITLDAGTRFILPYFKFKGIKSLDAIVITHPDADHLGGIPAILRELPVGQIFEGQSISLSSLYKEYESLLDSISGKRVKAATGMSMNEEQNMRILTLHPPNPVGDSTKRQSLNNQSVVLKMIYGKTSILLTGDAETVSEELLMCRYDGFLKSDILKVAHHGSKSGTSGEFLRVVHPHTAVISVGAKNKFRHPSPEVLNRLDSMRCGRFRTDESGAIIFESDGEQWTRVEWK
jgi:competence protein ComEC